MLSCAFWNMRISYQNGTRTSTISLSLTKIANMVDRTSIRYPSSVRPRSATRVTWSPSTGDPFWSPLFECFEPTGPILRYVERDNDVVDDRPTFAR